MFRRIFFIVASAILFRRVHVVYKTHTHTHTHTHTLAQTHAHGHREFGEDYRSIWAFSDTLKGRSPFKFSEDVLNRVIIPPRFPCVLMCVGTGVCA